MKKAMVLVLCLLAAGAVPFAVAGPKQATYFYLTCLNGGDQAITGAGTCNAGSVEISGSGFNGGATITVNGVHIAQVNTPGGTLAVSMQFTPGSYLVDVYNGRTKTPFASVFLQIVAP
jgi:hypothetical protein